MSKNFRKGWFVDDKSGFREPRSKLVVEPGTGWVTTKENSDGKYNLVDHPQNFSARPRKEMVPFDNIRGGDWDAPMEVYRLPFNRPIDIDYSLLVDETVLGRPVGWSIVNQSRSGVNTYGNLYGAASTRTGRVIDYQVESNRDFNVKAFVWFGPVAGQEDTPSYPLFTINNWRVWVEEERSPSDVTMSVNTWKTRIFNPTDGTVANSTLTILPADRGWKEIKIQVTDSVIKVFIGTNEVFSGVWSNETISKVGIGVEGNTQPYVTPTNFRVLIYNLVVEYPWNGRWTT